MREIKFRAWDKNKSTFICNWQDSQWIEYQGFNGGDAFNVMQWTGLKDKHGTEIYEGDIVAEYDALGERIDGPTAIQSTELGGFSPFEYDGGGEFDLGCSMVIGNIHANPELIEQSK